ncbi:MAG: hypothetical protein HQL94_03215 [Magnetococcales bacterium]|nr:hypothetical protein [Magnetococcales bacterium]MBF0438002.1 hypothetical protein [Magnetococcales bacterium]
MSRLHHHFWKALILLTGFALGGPAFADSWPTLGRLFTTPETRDLLNKTRSGKPSFATDQKIFDQSDHKDGLSIPIGPRYLSISGMVLKENGAHSIWLNGKNIETAKGFVGENYRLEPTTDPSRGVHIILMEDPTPFLLLPGQTLDAEEKKIRPTHEIPAQTRKTATRGGDPELPEEPKTTQAIPQEEKPTPADAIDPEKIFANAKKVKEAGKPGGLEGLIKTSKEVIHAIQ